MNHEFRVTVYGWTQLSLVQQAVARADQFYGEGNWQEYMPADVSIKRNAEYEATYYFMDAPAVDERSYSHD